MKFKCRIYLQQRASNYTKNGEKNWQGNKTIFLLKLLFSIYVNYIITLSIKQKGNICIRFYLKHICSKEKRTHLRFAEFKC